MTHCENNSQRSSHHCSGLLLLTPATSPYNEHPPPPPKLFLRTPNSLCPSLCSYGQTELGGPASPPLLCILVQKYQAKWQHISAPTLASKWFPLLFCSLHYLENIDSSLQTHLTCHLCGDAYPYTHMRITHPFLMLYAPIIKVLFFFVSLIT